MPTPKGFSSITFDRDKILKRNFVNKTSIKNTKGDIIKFGI